MWIRNVFVKLIFVYGFILHLYIPISIYVCIEMYLWEESNLYINHKIHLWILLCAFIINETVLTPYLQAAAIHNRACLPSRFQPLAYLTTRLLSSSCRPVCFPVSCLPVYPPVADFTVCSPPARSCTELNPWNCPTIVCPCAWVLPNPPITATSYWWPDPYSFVETVYLSEINVSFKAGPWKHWT